MTVTRSRAARPVCAPRDKILLLTLPFLTPLCPPVGVSCLKSFLQGHGFENVKTFDTMSIMEIREQCYRYFDTLKRFIPEDKQGHFFNIGLDVLSNHFMAHIQHQDEKAYRALIRLVVFNNYFVSIDDDQASALAAVTEEYFHELRARMLALIEKEAPVILGISIYRGTLPSSIYAARLVKASFPQIKIVIGGTIFSQELFPGTPNFNSFLENVPCIDKIFIGEGELLFLKYLNGRLPANKRIYSIEEELDGELIDLDAVDAPDYSDFHLENYPLLAAYTSRGCIYRCSFCAETVYWKKYHKMSIAGIVKKFQKLFQDYGKRLFVLTDCLINPVVSDLAKELIERDLRFYWDVYLKVDKNACDPQATLLWRKGGFYRARLGMESGSQHVLDRIDKKITVEQIKRTLDCLATAGIKTTTYWIAGHPGETEADFRETLQLLEQMQDYIYEAECDPFRYFYMGQVQSDSWLKQKGNVLLYPESAKDMLITQTWKLNATPSREESYDRQCRFREYCKKLGIPNPYSVGEIQGADHRWKLLHKNAVPALLEFQTAESCPDDLSRVSDFLTVKNVEENNVDFSF